MGDKHYAASLREAIESAGTSRRKLSFALASETGNQQPSEYRALGKYLSGDETPSPERAAILAVQLGEAKLALVSSSRRDRLGELAATVDDLIASVNDLKEQVADLKRRPAAARRASGGR